MDRNLEVPKVKDMLTSKVIALKPNFTQSDAIHIFNKYKISTSPVINDDNEVVGYLSESDCLKHTGNSLYFDEKMYSTIDQIMTKKIAVAESEWDLFELENFFISNHLKSAPVVDHENHLIGVVTRSDALMALEKVMHGREDYMKEVKTPIEINMQHRIKMILSRRAS